MTGLLMLLCLVGGVAFGSVITYWFTHRKTVFGLFRIDPVNDPEDPDLYTVNIALRRDPSLLYKKKIILLKDSSQN